MEIAQSHPNPAQEKDLTPLLGRFEQARTRREYWETHWQDCYDYALPQRGGFDRINTPGDRRMEQIYDSTAMDAVDQLAASLLGNLTPPWTQWFGLKPGPDLPPEEAEALSPVLETAGQTIQAHLDRSNFSVEMHQSFLDLVVGGTATLFVEETDPGSFSAFKFTSVPLTDVVLEEGENGFLDGVYRTMRLTFSQLKGRYPLAEWPFDVTQQGEREPQFRFEVLESILPAGGMYHYSALLLNHGQPIELYRGRFADTPAVAFRWIKSPGEVYGRSPVMKALPDIRTANKVVELILKNASIAVSGIWQADDDGVLNPANIDLTPGSIIPKAVGSDGLRPLDMPGRFDVSQLVLDDLRARIRHALLVDKLGQIGGPRMTATEVLERSSEAALLLGATYGRLQSELLTPLVRRVFSILKQRGEIPDIVLDGRYVTLEYRSPLARAQGQRSVQSTVSWITSVLGMGPEAALAVNLPQAARFIGESLGVPDYLIRKDVPLPLTPDQLTPDQLQTQEQAQEIDDGVQE